MLTSIKLRFTARRVPGGLLLLRDRATGGHGHARLSKFGQWALDLAKLPGFLLSGGRANGHGHYPVHPYLCMIPSYVSHIFKIQEMNYILDDTEFLIHRLDCDKMSQILLIFI